MPYAFLLDQKTYNVTICSHLFQFYNLVLFMSSVAVFSLAAQKMNTQR